MVPLVCCRTLQAIRTQLSAATSENQRLVGQLASLKQQLAAASAAAANASNTAASAAAEKALAEANKRAERLASQVGLHTEQVLWYNCTGCNVAHVIELRTAWPSR